MQKGAFWIPVICYCSAAAFAVLAIAVFFNGFQTPYTGWLFVLGGVLMGFVGIHATNVLRTFTDELQQSQSKLELVETQVQSQKDAVDHLADGLEIAIFMCDKKANILYSNRGAQEMFNFKEQDGHTILAVTLSYDLEQLVLDTFQFSPQRAELTFSHPTERIGLVHAWAQPDGTRAFVSIYEITDLRRLERVRKDFVSNVSHELRTPLTIIRAMAETMLDEPEDKISKHSKYLEKAIAEVDRLSMISSDLLVLSAAESNPVKKQDCNIAEITKNIVQQLTIKAQEKNLELNYSGPDSLNIQANGSQLTQVMMNLVDNAINYSNEGKIHVSIEDNDEVIITVQDTGIGIPSEHLPRIFERFYRVDKARARATGGTGLGLSIVKHIVEAHGGTVQVKSELNKGSTFTIRLPKA